MTDADPPAPSHRDVVADPLLGEAFPLSAAQYGVWLAYRLDPDISLSIAQCIDVRGKLDVGVLRQAYGAAGREFETFAVRLVEVDGRPYQLVDHSLDVSVDLIDLRAHADPVTAAHEWMERDYTEPLDVLR